MIVRCADPSVWCHTWQRLPDGTLWVPDADRPAGDVFSSDPVDLDGLSPQAVALWRLRQVKRYGR